MSPSLMQRHQMDPDKRDCVDMGQGNETRTTSTDGIYFEVGAWNVTNGGDTGDTVAQMPFNLKMWRFDLKSKFSLRCDGPGSPTSYLPCLTGKPLDGMRCKLRSMDNVDLSNKTDLQIIAQRFPDNDQ
ncbi:hypothetical protein PSPO01_01233 [Paraphaeosphaeria sporulosa]